MNIPGNHGLVHMQNDNHVDYDRRNNYGNPEHELMPNGYHVDYDRRYYSGNSENVPIPNEPPIDYDRGNDHNSHF